MYEFKNLKSLSKCRGALKPVSYEYVPCEKELNDWSRAQISKELDLLQLGKKHVLHWHGPSSAPEPQGYYMLGHEYCQLKWLAVNIAQQDECLQLPITVISMFTNYQNNDLKLVSSTYNSNESYVVPNVCNIIIFSKAQSMLKAA